MMNVVCSIAYQFKAYSNLMKYARVLLSNCPSTTTELFIEYYGGDYQPRTQQVEPLPEPQAQNGNPLQSLAAFLPLPLLKTGLSSTTTETVETQAPEVQEEHAPEYQIPKPRTAFSAFVGHPQEFITFLEALTSKENFFFGNEDKVDLYTTLFEMYLNAAGRQKDTAEKEKWQNKAKKLIEGKDVSIVFSDYFSFSFFFSLLFLRGKLTTSRFRFQPLVSYCFPIYPSFRRALHLSGNKLVFDRIYFDLSLPPKIHRELLGR
jgi:hypothetical protein